MFIFLYDFVIWLPNMTSSVTSNSPERANGVQGEIDEYHEHKTLFSDTFETHADYSKGSFYGMRRLFLVPQNSAPGAHLHPPEMFMTKAQMRRFLMKGEKKNLDLKQFDFRSAAADTTAANNVGSSIARKERKKVIYLEKFSSTKPEDWEFTVQAGVKIWVNHGTGEVSTECPWGYSQDRSHFPKGVHTIDSSFIPTFDGHDDNDDDDDEAGCGSLVYDNKELVELFEMLDSPSKK